MRTHSKLGVEMLNIKELIWCADDDRESFSIDDVEYEIERKAHDGNQS